MVTRTPLDPRPDDGATGEVLDELGDDAIVAQQSQPHSPRPRAQVAMESRSIVIAPDAELGGEPKPAVIPPPRQQQSTEPTLVIRDRKMVEELQSLRPPELAPRRQWGMGVIWVSAAVLAFGLGGLLALLSRSRNDAAEPTAAQQTFVTPVPTTRHTASAPPAEPAASAAVNEPAAAPSASHALLEPSAQPPRARSTAPSKPSRQKAAREPAPAPAAAPAQPKSDFPSGI